MRKALKVKQENFGGIDNQPVYLFTLRNANNNSITITNYGGIITSWLTSDKNGIKSNIVAGLSTLGDYEINNAYFGAIAGRYCNRIRNGSFWLDGHPVQLSCNDGNHHLHGGVKGFDKVVWLAHVPDPSRSCLQLRYVSKNREEGYPGNLYVMVEYNFSDQDELQIEYRARTDAPTPVSLTNHSYFNLSGDFRTHIKEHLLWLNAYRYTAVDDCMIPDGRLLTVINTPFDFTTQHPIEDRFGELYNGYDHNFVLNHGHKFITRAAVLSENSSGRQLDVFTSEPGVQFYTGNHLNGSFRNDSGHLLQKTSALCLETQHFPDSPNQPKFPSCILRPGENYYSKTVYKISLMND